jgi:hypothetical protein
MVVSPPCRAGFARIIRAKSYRRQNQSSDNVRTKLGSIEIPKLLNYYLLGVCEALCACALQIIIIIIIIIVVIFGFGDFLPVETHFQEVFYECFGIPCD